jgi:hypothetical protein
MKINFISDPGDSLSDYNNIDITAAGFSPYLDGVCDLAECQSIIAMDVLNYFSSLETDSIVNRWILLLRHGGKLVIGGYDALSIAKGIVQRDLSLVEANIMLFGEQNMSWDFRRCIVSSMELVQALKAMNLKINKNIVGNYRYTIEAERL